MNRLTFNTSYNSSLAAELVDLASVANQPIDSNLLPDNWKLLYKFIASDAGGSQYFLSKKEINGCTVCALVTGTIWNELIPYYIPWQNHVLSPLSSEISGPVSSEGEISVDIGFSSMYHALRVNLWSDIKQVKDEVPGFGSDLPLITVGLGPAAPLAQIAAIDLRPRKKPNDPSPATSVQNYIFSSPAFGNDAYQGFVASSVPDSYRVQADGDLFSSEPNEQSGYYQAGIKKSLPLHIPRYDSPWQERDYFYYKNLLNHSDLSAGIDNGADEDGTDLMESSVNYDSALAFTLGQLIAVTYQQYQHPGSSVSFNYKPYELVKNFTINDSVWIGLFEGPDYLVAAIRGSVSWLELMNDVSNSNTSSTSISWLPRGFGRYSKPAVEAYNFVRDSFRGQLEGMSRRKPLLLASHGFGGTLANLIAVDLKLQQPGGKLHSVYTLGAIPGADLKFSKSFKREMDAVNFQIVRPLDVMPKVELPGFFTVGTSIILKGGSFDPANGTTYHSLSSYLNLLDPAAKNDRNR